MKNTHTKEQKEMTALETTASKGTSKGMAVNALAVILLSIIVLIVIVIVVMQYAPDLFNTLTDMIIKPTAG